LAKSRGLVGTFAAKIETSFENELNPYAFLDSTLNLYLVPAVRGAFVVYAVAVIPDANSTKADVP